MAKGQELATQLRGRWDASWDRVCTGSQALATLPLVCWNCLRCSDIGWPPRDADSQAAEPFESLGDSQGSPAPSEGMENAMAEAYLQSF